MVLNQRGRRANRRADQSTVAVEPSGEVRGEARGDVMVDAMLGAPGLPREAWCRAAHGFGTTAAAHAAPTTPHAAGGASEGGDGPE
jgi:hypothetical protein